MKEYGIFLCIYNLLFIALAFVGRWLDQNKKLIFEHEKDLTIDSEIVQCTDRNFQTKPAEPEEEEKVPDQIKEIQMTEMKLKRNSDVNLVDLENIKVEKRVTFEDDKIESSKVESSPAQLQNHNQARQQHMKVQHTTKIEVFFNAIRFYSRILPCFLSHNRLLGRPFKVLYLATQTFLMYTIAFGWTKLYDWIQPVETKMTSKETIIIVSLTVCSMRLVQSLLSPTLIRDHSAKTKLIAICNTVLLLVILMGTEAAFMVFNLYASPRLNLMAFRLLPVVFISEFIIFDFIIMPILLFTMEITVGLNGEFPALEAP